MIGLIQRVKQARVSVDHNVIGEIEQGILLLLGVDKHDDETSVKKLAKKVASLRIFEDENHIMNLSLKDINGEMIIVSQFTLQASTKKGNRPSYIKAAKPDVAIPLYETFVRQMELELGKKVQTGQFGADMKVSLINDGPVTIIIDSKNKE